ncbi:hypothetical protein FOL46_007097 [Perkinsus olseni]|nr:hypothetical protein FOL46_007097 [Perkinsus olseni]
MRNGHGGSLIALMCFAHLPNLALFRYESSSESSINNAKPMEIISELPVKNGREKPVDIPIDPPGVKFSLRTFLKYTGPGWLMSLAYLDPGNLEADLQSGAFTGYQMLWVLLLAHIVGLILQVLSCRLAAVTGEHLAEHCRARYARWTARALWVMTEIAIIGSDIQEVLGTAIAFRVLFNIPLWAGTIITAVDTLTFLALHLFHGIRVLEAFIFVLILTMMLCFFIDMGISAPPAVDIFKGFVPMIASYAVMQMVGLIGAVIMPHNLYLHSALTRSRRIDRREERNIKQANKYFLIDSSLSLSVSFVINLAMVSAFAHGMFSVQCATRPHGPLACLVTPEDWDSAVCNPNDAACQCHTPEGIAGVCANIGLENAAGALAAVMYSRAVKYIFAVGVLAAGQASTLTGTLAGQYVMEGFMRWKIPMWLRVIITRSIALGPALAFAILQGEIKAMNGVNAWLNILQSIQLPFALLPVLHFSVSREVLGRFVICPFWTVLMWMLACLVIGVNFYLVIETIVPLGWPWYAWVIIAVVACLYITMCIACVKEDLMAAVRKVVGLCHRPARSALNSPGGA